MKFGQWPTFGVQLRLIACAGPRRSRLIADRILRWVSVDVVERFNAGFLTQRRNGSERRTHSAQLLRSLRDLLSPLRLCVKRIGRKRNEPPLAVDQASVGIRFNRASRAASWNGLRSTAITLGNLLI